MPESITAPTASTAVTERFIWINFGHFSNELIVARQEDGELFRKISETLENDSRQPLKEALDIGQVGFASFSYMGLTVCM